ncbi:MAG: DUF3106 domain-containing protein [Gammaproteobacteria bacterium]|nr:DUF3106 domain-containing protein [Gammaproteobacteria bacterium]
MRLPIRVSFRVLLTAALAAMICGSALEAAPRQEAGYAPFYMQLAARGVPWHQLSPEERGLLKQHRPRWRGYSPQRQEQLQQGAHRYLSLTPEQRREVEQQRRRFERMSPAERERLREQYLRQQRR